MCSIVPVWVLLHASSGQADAYSHPNADTDSYQDSYTHANQNPDTNAYSVAHPNQNTYADTYAVPTNSFGAASDRRGDNAEPCES
jgi:homoserine acetyltransferase